MEGPFNQFVFDMENAGYEVIAYRGRFHWYGPAVRCEGINEFQRIARDTNVTLEWDEPIAYPRQQDEPWYNWAKENGY